MSIEEHTAGRIEAELERLEAEYGDFAVHEERWRVPPEGYERVRERAAVGTVGGAGVWLTNDDGEVLLVSDVGREGWAEPAGKQEAGETLEEAAIRETREETGIECEIEGVALAQVLEIVPEGESAPPLSRLVVAFEGTYRGGTPRPRDDDIEDVRWWDEHPDRLVYEGLADLEIPADDDG